MVARKGCNNIGIVATVARKECNKVRIVDTIVKKFKDTISSDE